MMKEQKLMRVFPPGYTEDTKNKLNLYLSNGWEVKFITPIEKGIHDYIIERVEETNETN